MDTGFGRDTVTSSALGCRRDQKRELVINVKRRNAKAVADDIWGSLERRQKAERKDW